MEVQANVASMARPRTPKGRAREVLRRLTDEYDAICELDHRNAYELLTATILSAQTTDKRVNLVTPALFAAYPTPEDLAHANLGDVEELVRSTGFYATKAKNIVGMAQRLVDVYGGEVPGRIEDLVTLPGVGRKTANVVRSVALGLPGLPVDTHVHRVGGRLGLFPARITLEAAHDEMLAITDRDDAYELHINLIEHGRRICRPRPRCAECALARMCVALRAGLVEPVG